ncbi:MAG: hypothetical protein Q7J79_09380 [Gemmatimonadales bacterium]|nr:hypothetical protein [Gemmatimonadales bacterium]
MHDDDPSDTLSPAEQQAFDALPREQMPPSSLEDRTVALLRAHGHLPTPITVARHLRWRGPWLVGAVAASLALFASGMALGQYLGTRNAVLLVAAGRNVSAAELAGHVERAGSNYVNALTLLAQLRDTSDVASRAKAREAALHVLGAAAEEIAHLAPNDPLAAAVLRGLDQRLREQRPAPPSRSVVWF